jgi:putative peptide zinc metalloprotease protein
MTATAESSAPPVEGAPQLALNRADGVALVRRGDGQMVQLGPLMYALLESVDGSRDERELAHVVSERLGRRLEPEHVVRLAQKLAAQGLLAGTEHRAPPRRNPLLALRWKVLVTDPLLTRRLTQPFTVFFRPWLMWPIVACFAGVFWFVLIHKGVASATAQAFKSPGLFVLVFVAAVLSAGFHEVGHASAARHGGATPGGMGVGLYLVWPAFYTDVTDAYRLPRRDRLRADLAGLYFNAIVAVVTMAIWLVWRADALLLLVALQVLQMVKQLSPVIRADGYHILSDATGVPDLYAHMAPTLRRLLPGHRREPSALTGWARLLVTIWVLVVVPVLIALSLSAIILLPRLATSAWDSGRHIALTMSHQAGHGQILAMVASLVSLVALILPVFGSALVTQKIVRTVAAKALNWSRGDLFKRAAVAVAGVAVAAGAAWAWWPSGQYQPVLPNQNGTLGGVVKLVSAPAAVARPTAGPVQASLTPGTHLAVAMIPVGGATKSHPALFIIPGKKGKAPVAILSSLSPNPSSASGGSFTGQPSGAAPTAPATPSSSSGSSGSTTTSPSPATAFPFKLPAPPGPGGTQALAENTTNGGVRYDVAYALVTVTGGAPVTNTNSAYALAHCNACTTVAVSFQVVLVVGQSKVIAPINAAGALNYDCPACTTTAIADQIVVTLKSLPSGPVLARLEAALRELNALPALGAGGSPAAVASEVAVVQQQIETTLAGSGLLANPPTSNNTTTSATSSAPGPGSSSSTGSTSGSGQSSPAGSSTASQQGSSASPSSSPAGSSASPTTTTTSTTTTTPSSQSSGSATSSGATTTTGSSG